MIAYLERLRLLRRAAGEGLISDAEFAQQRKRLLRAAASITMQQTENGLQGVAEHGASGEESKRAWQALVAALVDVLECHANDARRRVQPAAVATASPSHNHDRDDAVANTVRQGAAAQVAPAVAPAAAGARSGAERVVQGQPVRPQFTYDRYGLHWLTREPVPEMDPLEIDVSQLFRDPEPDQRSAPDTHAVAVDTKEVAVQTETQPDAPAPAPFTGPMAREPRIAPRTATVARPAAAPAARATARPLAPSPAGLTRPRPRRALPAWRPGGISGAVARQRRPAPTAPGKLLRRPSAVAAAAAPRRVVAAPVTVRHAAEYVAEAAGLDRPPSAPQPRTSSSPSASAPAAPAAPAPAPPVIIAVEEPSGAPPASLGATGIRFTLHAEIVV